MDPALQEANTRIQNALEYLKTELSGIRAGRANPSLVENVLVSVYGGQMKLMEVATISAPQPSLLTISVWDASIIQDVLKSLQEANLGLNPSNEGNVIRLPIPPLTAERREEFIKLVHQKMELARIEIRQIRQDIRDGWKKLQETAEVSEDEFLRREKLLQLLLDQAQSSVDELGKQKQAELREI